MNELVSRTTTPVLLLLEVGSGDSGVLGLPAGFQNSQWDKKQKSNLSSGIAAIRCLRKLAYSSGETMST